MTKKFLTLLVSTFALMVFSSATFAADVSPAGTWTTISDKDGKPRSIVRTRVSRGTLYASIVKVFPRPGDKKVCIYCTGSRKNKKIIGMTFLWGMKKVGPNKWSGGRILDPETGKIYRCNITVASGGKKLIVRGYVGVSAIGRSQNWIRR